MLKKPPFTSKSKCLVCGKPIKVTYSNNIIVRKYCNDDCRQTASYLRLAYKYLLKKNIPFTINNIKHILNI